jgi:hypothetical protein
MRRVPCFHTRQANSIVARRVRSSGGNPAHQSAFGMADYRAVGDNIGHAHERLHAMADVPRVNGPSRTKATRTRQRGSASREPRASPRP